MPLSRQAVNFKLRFAALNAFHPVFVVSIHCTLQTLYYCVSKETPICCLLQTCMSHTMDAENTCHRASSIGLQASAGGVPVPHLAS
jgi:hypothetical protein